VAFSVGLRLIDSSRRAVMTRTGFAVRGGTASAGDALMVVLVYIAAALTGAWGVAHLFAT